MCERRRARAVTHPPLVVQSISNGRWILRVVPALIIVLGVLLGWQCVPRSASSSSVVALAGARPGMSREELLLLAGEPMSSFSVVTTNGVTLEYLYYARNGWLEIGWDAAVTPRDDRIHLVNVLRSGRPFFQCDPDACRMNGVDLTQRYAAPTNDRG